MNSQFSEKKQGRNLTLTSKDLRKCNRCNGDIALIRSERTGKYYPVEVREENRISGDSINVVINDFHKCPDSLAKIFESKTEIPF